MAHSSPRGRVIHSRRERGKRWDRVNPAREKLQVKRDRPKRKRASCGAIQRRLASSLPRSPSVRFSRVSSLPCALQLRNALALAGSCSLSARWSERHREGERERERERDGVCVHEREAERAFVSVRESVCAALYVPARRFDPAY